uniref:(northern house mosquito) hypothetical protein n=1 Tax=Culex pipiens TaxID=7175 RepID=A0A8D8HAE2_CULPI
MLRVPVQEAHVILLLDPATVRVHALRRTLVILLQQLIVLLEDVLELANLVLVLIANVLVVIVQARNASLRNRKVPPLQRQNVQERLGLTALTDQHIPHRFAHQPHVLVHPVNHHDQRRFVNLREPGHPQQTADDLPQGLHQHRPGQLGVVPGLTSRETAVVRVYEPERSRNLLVPTQVGRIGRREVNVGHQLARVQDVTVPGLGRVRINQRLNHLGLVHHLDRLRDQRILQRNPLLAGNRVRQLDLLELFHFRHRQDNLVGRHFLLFVTTILEAAPMFSLHFEFLPRIASTGKKSLFISKTKQQQTAECLEE